jgi:hypothetical protein
MALHEFTHLTGKGNKRTRIVHSPTTGFSLKNPAAYGKFVSVKVFKYKYENPYMGPTLFTDNKGQKFITPGWIPVVPETTYNDIDWIKPKVAKVKEEAQTWKFESSSDPGTFYMVRKVGETYKCSCPGVWRSKNRKCKHILKVENDNK